MHDDVYHGDVMLTKTLWRMSQGSMSKAYAIIRSSAPHYGMKPEEIQDHHIEWALAEMNGGVEVEWLTP